MGKVGIVVNLIADVDRNIISPTRKRWQQSQHVKSHV